VPPAVKATIRRTGRVG